MKLLRFCAPVLVLVSQLSFAGGSLDLSINNNTAALEYDATRMGTPLHISTGYLHHETDGDLISFGINAVDVRNAESHLRIGVGGKIYGYLTDQADSGALAVGGFVRYTPPELAGIGFAAHGYYAPSVLSFHSTENLADFGVRIEYKLLPTAQVYLGYRFVEANDEAGDIDVVKAGHFGLRINF